MEACTSASNNIPTFLPNTSIEKPAQSDQGEDAYRRRRPHSANSPNFNFLSAGNEAEKLKWLVLKHVKPSTFKKIFAPLMSRTRESLNRSDELCCIEACMLLKALEPDPNDKNRQKQAEEFEKACQELIGLLNTEKLHLRALDRIITRIIVAAAQEKIISLPLACQLLVTSIDLRMQMYPNPEKLTFVRQCMDQMDYKNMRDLLKLLLVEKLDKMHCQLNQYEHMNLAPIEELVIDLIDRKKNFCPALFFITEISRIDTDHSSIHFLPRVSLKIREMVASFRPLAEIGCMLGRSWMWPVPASPIFSWSSQTWSAWKLDEKHCKLYFKTHLPYSSENSSPQTYLQYILFKQPHGQDNLNHILRPNPNVNPQAQVTGPRLQCDEVIQLLILEAMCAMEDSEQPVLAPINQYNWTHLSHLVTYALSMGHCTLSHLLMMLLPQLKSCQYLRAKEELMWILLQYIAHAKLMEKQQKMQQQIQSGQQPPHISAMIPLPVSGGLGAQNRELVLEIFNVLYTEKSDKSMNWGDTCSTEQPLNMVRFFAPAAIWLHLVSSPIPGADQLPQPQPPEKLRTLIEFIERQLSDNKEQKQLESNPALLAIVANAYSNNHEIFDEHVSNTVFHMLGHQLTNLPHPHMPQEKWILPGGRRTERFLRALDLNFLDSLTFHAKHQLYHNSLNQISNLIFPWLSRQQSQQQQTVSRLPSPALVESTARLLMSTELCDQNGKRFIKFALYWLKQAQHTAPEEQVLARNDSMAIALELLNYRLQNIGFGWKWEIQTRFPFLKFIVENLVVSNIGELPTPSNIQMCQLQEHTVLRFAQCTWPQDILNILQQKKNDKVVKHFFKILLESLPELYRAFILCALRASKLLGEELLPADVCLRWPRSDLQWFPAGIQQFLCEHLAQNEQEWMNMQAKRMLELEQASAQEMQHLALLDAEYFGQTQPNPTAYGLDKPPALLVAIFRCLYQFKLPNFQFPQPAKPPHPTAPSFFTLCYKIIGSLGNKEMHRLTNGLVDWLAWKCAWLVGQAQPTQSQEEYDLNIVSAILNDMLFSHQFLSVERLLYSMVLYPTDDQSIQTILCLLASLLDRKISQLPERLHACYSFAPAHSQTTSSNSDDFFVQMAEYHKKYPEYSCGELYWRAMNPQQPEPHRETLNLPVYYGHLAERICPLVDFLLQRALQLDIKPTVFDTLLRHFSPIYRIHPQPMTFLYMTLYSLDGILSAQQQKAGGGQMANRPVRKFVLEIVMKLEQEEPHQQGRTQFPPTIGKLLSLEFIQHDHQMPAIKFCRVLVERIVQASTYTHTPPSFVHRDWRFAEFSPAAQALTSAWVELMASRHSPADIIEALVQLAIRRPISRPQDTLNALGLLLTGLPSTFQCAFLNKIEQSFEWDQLANPDADPAQLFESLSHEVYLHSESKILSMLALIHSFCQHGGNNSLGIIPDLINSRLAPKVQNEAQLLYFLRIVVPYLQRIHEKERSRHMPEIVHIYQVLSDLTQKVGKLRYEDTICDLLYQFKYMFVGYTLKDQTEQPIRSFPDSMREKLKYLLTQSSSAAVAAENQQQQMQMLQQQQILQHQSSQGSLFSGQAQMAPSMLLAAQQQAAAMQLGFGHQQPAFGHHFDPSMGQPGMPMMMGTGPLPAAIQGHQGQMMVSSAAGTDLSSNAQFPSSQAPTNSMQQHPSSIQTHHLDPPPPYPQGSVQMASMIPGQRFPNSGGPPMAHFQQMMAAQQHMAAMAHGQQFPVVTSGHQYSADQQMGFASAQQAHMMQMARSQSYSGMGQQTPQPMMTNQRQNPLSHYPSNDSQTGGFQGI